MDEKVQNQLVSELARDLIASAAPQELPLFPALSNAYFRDPKKTLAEQKPKDEALGFGIAEPGTFATPFVLAMVTEVLKYLMSLVSESIEKEGTALADEAVKRVFKKFHRAKGQSSQAPEGLRPEQIAQVRRLAFERACQLNLPVDQANLLADSLVGGLVTIA